MTDTRKQTLVACLRRWIAQRPGLEFGNYGDARAYRAEMRSITKDRHHAERMLQAIEWRDSITADAIIAAARGAYSGRLSIKETTPGRFVVDYCTGQYWPTEYRRAVCAVLSSALWDYWRDNAPVDAGPIESHSNLQNVGDYLRTTARREFGRTIAQRWFS